MTLIIRDKTGLRDLGTIEIEEGVVKHATGVATAWKGWVQASVKEYVKTCGFKTEKKAPTP